MNQYLRAKLFIALQKEREIYMKKAKQEGSLNVLKLLATITIVLAHYQQTSGSYFEGKFNFFNGSFFWGYMVELFFILSGYFAYGYSQITDPGDNFFSFWWKKYKRFLPLMLITGFATIAVLGWMYVRFGTPFDYSMWACLGGMLGFGRWLSNDIILNNPTWYINVLLLCYAVFYFTTFLARRTNTRPSCGYLCVVFIGILMYYLTNTYHFSAPFISSYIARGLFCFFFGLLLRELLNKCEPHKKPLWIALSALYMAGFIYLYIHYRAFVADNLYYILCTTVFPATIILFKTELLQRLCSAQFFSHLSGITYHTFMWHTPLRYLYLSILRILEISVTTMAAMYFCLIVSFVVGTGSYLLEGEIKKHKKQKKVPSGTTASA